MKNNYRNSIICALGLMAGLAGLNQSTLAADKDFWIGDAQLCGSLVTAVERLKKKGFFKDAPAVHIEQGIKNGYVKAQKSNINNYLPVQYRLWAKNGKIVRIVYSGAGIIDGKAEYRKGKKLADKAMGVSTRSCHSIPGHDAHFCNYNAGTTRIKLRHTEKENSYHA